MTALLFTHNKR